MNSEWLRLLGDHLWQSTLFAAAAGLSTLALRRNRARVRYALWMAASCKFLVPVFLLIALWGNIAWRIAWEAAPAAMESSISMVLKGASQPFTAPAHTVSVPAATPITAPITVPAAVNPLPAILFSTWLCGFAGIAFSWWTNWRRIRAAVRAGSSVRLEIPIRAITSRALIEPGIFGIFRPILLLPDGIFDRLTPAELNTVVAHELCHFRHWDNLIAAVHMLVETVFWFHPLVWWIGKRMVWERELACDEEVIQLGNQPRVYAAGILKVCSLYVESPLACLSGVTGADLRKRIRKIVSGRVAEDLSITAKAGLVAAGTACLALPILIGVWSAPPLQGQNTGPLSPPSGAKFSSVVIERCNTYQSGEIQSPAPGRLVAKCLSPASLIYTAWLKSATDGAQLIPLSGEPVWVDSNNYLYRIDARADPGTSFATMEGPMLQALLADRFGLKVRRVTRELPMYALTVAKGGPRLQPSKDETCRGAVTGVPRMPPPLPHHDNCGPYPIRGSLQYETLEGRAMSLADLCSLLAGPLGRPVIDKTGISGTFDFHVKFAGNDTPALLRQLYPSIFNVVEEQFGLKLEPITGPREFLVVEQVKQPLPG